MDWFSWLSKTNLDPSLVYDYALTFTYNELQEEDITYFSHDFLQSMGVSIAKHRLEILKLVRKEKSISIKPVLWFVFAIKQTKNYLAKHIHALVHRETSALSVVPTRNHSLRWKVAMLQRNKRLRVIPAKPAWPMLRNDNPIFVSGNKSLMLTNGSPVGGSQSSGSTKSSSWIESEANAESGHITQDAPANAWNSSFSSTVVHSLEGEYWSSSTEEIKWDSMFQNLKPT
ncbi:UNVERIFIED_CONTAM: hypothetical protein Sangu_0101600 [Sesamum angustifolium]|uniref:SAM domain-containing protein n=1 Tax=Sesamum angustifolium TaxID=2727405 RepID=A0AAW2RLQ4_9LAMI